MTAGAENQGQGPAVTEAEEPHARQATQTPFMLIMTGILTTLLSMGMTLEEPQHNRSKLWKASFKVPTPEL